MHGVYQKPHHIISKRTLCATKMMSKKMLHIDWKSVDGAAVKKRMLKFARNDEGLFPCPVLTCLHLGFKSDRGARKHVNTVHPWYLFFDQQPLIDRSDFEVRDKVRRKSTTHNIPAYSLTEGIGKEFLDWLQTPCGGGKTAKQAVQSGRRAMKFLMASVGESEVDKHLNEDFIDCCLGSPSIVINFFKISTEVWKITSSAALNYMKSVSDLVDWRKSNGVSDNVLRSFAVSEVYIRRGKDNLSKKKKVEYSRNLDLEQLICRQSWATVEEMEEVIPYHTPRYKYVLDLCKEGTSPPGVSQLAFASRFLATFLFLRVKCTRPMTYQYITLNMVEEAKANGGFIDQTTFKTEKQYAFDTLVLSEEVLQIIDTYVSFIRPQMKPKCNYLILTTNGKQYSAFGTAMSILVHQAIEKYVNPTRYRQIIESESAERLSPEEMDFMSKDQKHSSYVARRIYQKKLSRTVALQGKSCMEKITGDKRDQHTREMANLLCHEAQGSDHEENASTEVNVDVEEVLMVTNTANYEDAKEEEEDCQVLLSPSTNVMDDVVSLDIDSDPVDDSTPSTSNNIEDTKEVIPTRSTRSSQLEMPLLSTMTIEVKKETALNEVKEGQIQKRFCSNEDAALREGVKKHGLGKWAVMLKDKTLNFHPSRTRDSIRMRAVTLGLSKKKKKKRGAVKNITDH